MAWQEIDIANAKINMSKVVPYDSQLSILDKKQGYYHNNRLTALNKWVTDSAVGYKCYKRKGSEDHKVDGEITDYIEINKVLENGSIDHMIDIADSYYKLEKEAHDDNSNLPEFVQGIVLGDTLIGKQEDWIGFSFFNVKDESPTTPTRIIGMDLSKNIYAIKLLHTKKPLATENYKKTWVGNLQNGGVYVFKRTDENAGYYFVRGDSTFDKFLRVCRTKYSDEVYNDKKWSSPLWNEDLILNHNLGTTFWDANGDTFEKTSSCCNATTCRNNNDGSRDIAGYKGVNFDITFYVDEQPILKLKEKLYNNNNLQFDSYWVDISAFWNYGSYVNSITEHVRDTNSVSERKTGRPNSGKQSFIVSMNFKLTPLTYKSDSHVLTWGSLEGDIYIQNKGTYDSSKSIVVEKTLPLPSYSNDLNLNTLLVSENYQNDSVFTNNGFVVNYTNKLPVTLGHKYKVIARLDTQGAAYLGSDNKYSYISQNGEMYKISVEKMFPDVAYDEEVNIIENADYCQQVNGYKIFNTTTYYNAIYNDDKNKVICSCDDWNGRYKSNSATLSNATLKSTSRVGNFWNSTQSWDNIPNKAISDELNDILEIENPTYSWTNPDYTIHEGTKAYIYTQNNNQVDTMYQQWVVDKDGFRRDYSEDKQFTHNKPLQLVPSILFSHYLKSDVENIISIGSESYRLKTYSYSTTTPALVYQSIAESININPNSEKMVIQGSYYEISGSNDRRLITNPYDTSTTTYCCDVTGLKYIGYDSVQGYFYSPSTATIYTFNGANKLNAYLEVDNRIPMTSADKDGITVCNIPSINLVAMAFFDGVLLIINQQSVFIPVQNIQSLSANREYGIVRIGSSYYYFGTNSNIKSLIASTGGKSIIKVETLPPASSVEDKDNVVYLVTTTEKYYVVEKVFEPTISYKWTETTLDSLIGSSVTDKLIFKTSKIGFDRKTNATMSKQRLCVYSDNLEKGIVKVTITSRLGNKINTETYTKTIQPKEFIDNEFQWEFNQKFTKANWFTIECELDNLDLLNHYVEMSESTEENLVR